MPVDPRLDALLSDLYGTVLDPDRTDAFLGAVARASDSHLATITFQDFLDPARSRAYATGATPDELARYSRHAGDNIWIGRSMGRMHAGAALNGDDWVTPAELRRSRYYGEFLRTIDTLHSVALCGALDGSGAALVTLCRSAGAGPYQGEAMALLQTLAPHWANACALRDRLRLAQAQGLASAPLATGVFMLDAKFRCRDRNAAADRMLSQGWWCLRVDGVLESASAASRPAWRDARHSIADGSAATAPVFAIHDAGGRRVALAALHAAGRTGPGSDLPEHVLFVRPLVPVPGAAVTGGDRLRGLFGLTTAEAALALAFHRHGDIAAAAAELGIGERGARTRLQSLFDKTECRRQGELLRLLDAVVELDG